MTLLFYSQIVFSVTKTMTEYDGYDRMGQQR